MNEASQPQLSSVGTCWGALVRVDGRTMYAYSSLRLSMGHYLIPAGVRHTKGP